MQAFRYRRGTAAAGLGLFACLIVAAATAQAAPAAGGGAAGGTPPREAAGPAVDGAPRDHGQNWLFLFYDDADFTPGYDPFPYFSQDAHTAENVKVVVLQDTYGDTAHMWRVLTHGNVVHLGDWGELDMGDPATLRDFILQAQAWYPADRTLLAIYDHGAGWRGACADQTDGSWMTMDEMESGLAEAGGVDLVCFTAPCLMGAIESAYELRDCAGAYVGSEEGSGYIYWQGVMGGVCDLLNVSSDLSTVDVAAQIVGMVADHNLPNQPWLTMSAVDLAALEDAVKCLDDLGGLVADSMAAELDIVAAMREATQHFGMGSDPDYPIVDLVDFLERYASNRTNPLVLELLGEALASLDAAIVAECHGSLVPYAQGLSVYFPKTAADYDATYRACGLDWTALTQWDELLLAFYAAQERAAAVEIVAGPRVRCAPSPFREATRLRFAAAAAGPARLRVFDAAGRLVRRLHEGPLPAGDHDFVWDGRDARGRRLPAGVYLAVAETGGRRMAGKVLLLR